MGFKVNELELLQKLEQAESARRVKLAFREGLLRGLKYTEMNDKILKDLWNDSKARSGLEEDDITIPQFNDTEDITSYDID